MTTTMEMMLKSYLHIRRRRFLLSIFVLLLVIKTNLNGQVTAYHNIDIALPEIAIVDIEPNTNPVTLILNAPNNAGGKASIVNTTDSKWINYSSTFPVGGNTRKILVQTQNTMPGGMNLTIQASNYTGNGEGAFGISTGTVTLSTTPKSLITNIGRTYTGSGANNGHKITFSLDIIDYNLLKSSESKTLTVIYTITD